MIHQLEEFPYLTSREFLDACNRFKIKCEQSDISPWCAIEQHEIDEGSFLRIIIPLQSEQDVAATRSAAAVYIKDIDSVDEADSERLQRDTRPAGSFIEYDIILSPIYRVPVLYFVLHTRSHRALVPQPIDSKPFPACLGGQVDTAVATGVISYGDHPLTGRPAFFVHPCNTHESMKELAASLTSPLQQYICAWLGFTGKVAGLSVPRDVAVGVLK